MTYQERLFHLQEKIAEKTGLEAKYRELLDQKKLLSDRVTDLKERMKKEQADVSRLEQSSLSSVFYALVGKKTQKLDRERMEAYAAKVKYDAAQMELNHVIDDIREIQAQLGEIADLGIQYEELLNEKTEAILESGSEEAQRIFRMEAQIASAESQKKEIMEAITAGTRAQATAQSVLSSLDSAEGWGTWDLLGGGLLADLAKHSRLDEAQEQVHQLQDDLRRFKTELADVSINGNLKVSVDGFLRFADFFFDNLFTDWAVMDQINRSQTNVRNTEKQIESVLTRLRTMAEEKTAEIERLDAEKEQIIEASSL